MKKLSLFVSALALLTAGSAFADDAFNCKKLPSCDDLGFKETAASCISGSYQLCPFDTSKVACIENPTAGDIKHSLVATDHDGWLLCDGRSFSKDTYPDLYTVLGSTKLPDLRGMFLRAAGEASGFSNYGGSQSSLKNYKTEELPNITGSWKDTIENQSYKAPSGAVKQASSSGDGVAGDEGWFGRMKLEAAKTEGTGKGVYKDSGHVIPANYATYIYIYGGNTRN